MPKWSALFLLGMSVYFVNRLLDDRQRLVFKDSPKSVQDSMLVLRRICESVEPVEFMNCYVVKRNGLFIFNGEHLGNIDTVSVANKGFKGMKAADITQLLSCLKFLNRNDISGVVHDTSVSYWQYGYKEESRYNDRHSVRKIFIWSTPKDTLSASFSHYFKILDQKEQMVLISLKDVEYRKF